MENVKSLGFYSRLFLVPKPHHRWRPVIDLSRLNTFLHVEKFKMETPESIRTSLIPGEWVSLIDLSDAYLHIPIHPNSRKYLRFCHGSQVFQFTSLPFGLATAPQVFTMIIKEVKLMALSRGLQTSPIPGQLADQVPVSGGSPSEHSGSGRSNSVLGFDHKSGKIRTKSYSGVFIRGLQVSPRFSPCKIHSREMAQTSGFDPTTQVKTCFGCKISLIELLVSTDGPGGTPSHEALSISSQGAQEISSVVGQPPSLDRGHFCTPGLVAESCKRDERIRPSSQTPQHPTLYRHLKQRLGRSLRANLYQGSVVRSGKKATHKCPRLEGGFTGPPKVQGPVSKPNSSSCNGQLNSGSLQKETRGNSFSGDVCTPVEDYDIVPSLSHNIESQTHSRVSDVMANLLSRSNQVTEWSMHPQMFKQICHRWFTPHVDLFATHLNHKLPLYVSPIPDPKAWDIDALNINWTSHCLCLPSNGSPSQGDPKNQAMPLPDHSNSPRLARDALVLISLQLPVSTTLLKQSHLHVFHSNPQHLNLHAWCLGVDNSRNKASLWRWQRELLPLSGHQQGPFTSQSGPFLKNDAEKIRWASPLHL